MKTVKATSNIDLWIIFKILSHQVLQAETIGIAVLDYCPYQCDSEKEYGKIGFMPEIAKAVFEKAGLTVNQS